MNNYRIDFSKRFGRVCSALKYNRTETSGGMLKTLQWNFGSHKILGISWETEEQQIKLPTMEPQCPGNYFPLQTRSDSCSYWNFKNHSPVSSQIPQNSLNTVWSLCPFNIYPKHTLLYHWQTTPTKSHLFIHNQLSHFLFHWTVTTSQLLVYFRIRFMHAIQLGFTHRKTLHNLWREKNQQDATIRCYY